MQALQHQRQPLVATGGGHLLMLEGSTRQCRCTACTRLRARSSWMQELEAALCCPRWAKSLLGECNGGGGGRATQQRRRATHARTAHHAPATHRAPRACSAVATGCRTWRGRCSCKTCSAFQPRPWRLALWATWMTRCCCPARCWQTACTMCLATQSSAGCLQAWRRSAARRVQQQQQARAGMCTAVLGAAERCQG